MARTREPIWRVSATLNSSQLIKWTTYYGLKKLRYVVIMVGEYAFCASKAVERSDGHAEGEHEYQQV